MRLLIVERNRQLAESWARFLMLSGFEVACESLRPELENRLQAGLYDLLILDIGLPEFAAFNLLHKLRSAKSKLRILVLASEHDLEAQLYALSLGADDFLMKPIRGRDLASWAHRMLRRALPEENQ